MEKIVEIMDNAIDRLTELKRSKKFDDLMEILKNHSSTLPSGFYLESDPTEDYIHERDYEGVVNEIIDFLDYSSKVDSSG